MKPLELKVYPIWDDGFGTLYADKGDRTRPTSVGYMQVVKRLTEPELAADYWAMIAHFNKVQWAEMASGEPVKEPIWDELARRNATMYRFATTPHYFEEAA